MYKITQQKINDVLTDRYTVQCYLYDAESKTNKELYSWRNMTKENLEEFLRINSGDTADTDFSFVVLKSGNGPIILTDSFEAVQIPVKSRPARRLMGRTGWKLPS